VTWASLFICDALAGGGQRADQISGLEWYWAGAGGT
jgi:hypothetical protein